VDQMAKTLPKATSTLPMQLTRGVWKGMSTITTTPDSAKQQDISPSSSGRRQPQWGAAEPFATGRMMSLGGTSYANTTLLVMLLVNLQPKCKQRLVGPGNVYRE
ncbi:hypothetical protein MMC13_003365, partial [Lambiella insularis]|nr:hypothetical protein [Lambiella insularis]